MPERIQMNRQRPWRHEHPDAVIVARPTQWGNPYRVGVNALSPADAVAQYRACLPAPQGPFTGILEQGIREDLADRDLACWCPLDQPCHADVLLEIANS